MQGQQNQSPTPSISFFGSEFVENPYPIFAHMRSLGPIVPLPTGGNNKAWMVTRIEEAVQMLKDHRNFTVDAESLASGDFAARRAQRRSEGINLFGNSMISVDEPAHMRLRGLVSKAFTPKYIQSLRPRIQQLADELLDKVEPQGHMDLVHDYGYPFPINVISEMLGVPAKDREQIRVWSEAITNNISGTTADNAEKIRQFLSYIVQLVAEKRQNPGNDLISQLIQQEEEGDRLNEDELFSMIGLLIFAGHETTSNLIGIGTLTLLDHPEQLAKLKADLSLVPSAVEELLRFNGPVVMPAPRFVAQDIEFAGQQLHKGDFIIIALSSANRDAAQFTDADELDIARKLNRHIAFGQGIHICLGAPLARLEGDIAFTTLLKRMPNLKLNAPRESITWRGGGNLRGLTSLPLTF